MKGHKSCKFEFISRFSVPMQLHSDQGRNFESIVFSKMCKLLRIDKTRTTALHPQSDGMVERFNRTLGNEMAIFVEKHQKNWDEQIPLLLLFYRTAVHESTKQTLWSGIDVPIRPSLWSPTWAIAGTEHFGRLWPCSD